MSKPVLFLLEDNLSLADKLVRMAKRLDWVVVRARSLEEACRLCADPALTANRALIDLMIPVTDAALKVVDQLLVDRNEWSITATSRTATPNEREDAAGQINGIDRRIEELILDDGGIEFMKSDEGKRLLQGETKTAVFSARRGGKTPAERDQLVKDVKDALGGKEPDAWFDKPTNPMELETWLTKAP